MKKRELAVGAGLSLVLSIAAAGQECPVPQLPDDLFDAPVPNELLTTVAAELPENTNVDAAFLNPEYAPIIRVSEPARVTLTFLAEGAGFKNSLGYFTFTDATFQSLSHGHINTDGIDGVSIDELLAVPGVEVGMIFGNSSQQGAGGQLNAGDAQMLGGGVTFPPGTRIGFFLVQNGWVGSGVRGLCDNTQDSLVMYSLDLLNPECGPDDTLETNSAENQSRHTAMLFADINSESILMGFEDLHRTDRFSNFYNLVSDEDFNDAVFRVTSDPVTAIQSTEIPSSVPVFPPAPPGIFSVPDCCNVDTTDVIATYLPEQVNVDAAFLNPAYDPNLVVSVDTLLLVSFVDEGASYPNTLGAFTYPDGTFANLTKADVDADGDGQVSVDELAQVEGVSVSIVYQNAAKIGAGGPLLPRDTIFYGDGVPLTAGSRMGFFLIQDGWIGNGSIRGFAGHPTERLTFYSMDFLNPEAASDATVATDSSTNSSRHVAMLFSDDEFGSILLGFEDLHRLSPLENVFGYPSDEDFNDTIFCLTPVDSGALAATDIFVAGACPADLDGDGLVAFSDLLILISNWGTCDSCPGDLDDNGAVDFIDLIAVLVSYGTCEE